MAESSDDGGDEQQPEGPDLADEDYVDVPEEMAEAVAAATSGDEQGEGGDGEGSESSDEQADEQQEGGPLTSGTSVGDVYCNALGMAATLARERKGSGVDDREGQADEYADMARQIELDTFVNEWVEEHGAADHLSPGQGVLVGTAMFAMAVLIDDPELADAVAGEAAG